MSTTVLSKGFIFELLQPVTSDQAEEFYELDTPFSLTEDRKLLIFDQMAQGTQSEREFCGGYYSLADNSTMHVEAVLEQLKALPEWLVDITNTEVYLPYTAIWHNGSDSPMTYTTYEEFSELWQRSPAAEDY